MPMPSTHVPIRFSKDEAITDDADQPRAQRADDDAHRYGNTRFDSVQRFPRQHDVGSEEAHIHHARDDRDEQRAPRSKLGPALDHLRNAHLRALRRMQRHQHTADGLSHDDRDDAPEQVQMEELDAERPRYDRQRRDIAAEPEREEITHLAVTILAWHIANRVFFDQLGSFAVRGGQDAVSCLAQLRCDIQRLRRGPSALVACFHPFESRAGSGREVIRQSRQHHRTHRVVQL